MNGQGAPCAPGPVSRRRSQKGPGAHGNIRKQGKRGAECKARRTEGKCSTGEESARCYTPDACVGGFSKVFS